MDVPKRTQPPANTLPIRVVALDGKSYQGSVVAVDVDVVTRLTRVLVEFNRTHAPELAIGAKAILFLTEFGEEAPTQVPSVTIFRREDPVRRQYQFQVGKVIGIPRVRRSLGRLAARVRPFSGAPVEAAIQRLKGGAIYWVTLKDISATGVAVLVRMTDEPHLYSAWRLRLFLSLPGREEVLRFVGNVCHRRRVKDAIRYGIDFDAGATTNFERKQNAVSVYVSGCQAGWLRAMTNSWVRRTG